MKFILQCHPACEWLTSLTHSVPLYPAEVQASQYQAVNMNFPAFSPHWPRSASAV